MAFFGHYSAVFVFDKLFRTVLVFMATWGGIPHYFLYIHTYTHTCIHLCVWHSRLAFFFLVYSHIKGCGEGCLVWLSFGIVGCTSPFT
ncbi:hypothetical protein V8C42DRAFT_85200 [Trichoderma barbatum]